MATSSIAWDIVAKDRASDKFDKIGRSADKSSGRLKAFAKTGALAAGAAALAAGAALVGMAKAAAADAASQKKLEVALKNNTKATDKQVASVEDWITKQGLALGVADDKLRPALTRLSAATGSVSKSQKLASLAMDVSAGTGKDLEAVATALAKAQDGNVAALSRLGVQTKDAEGKTISFKEATQQLADVHGGQAAAAAETTEGKWKRLQLRWDEAQETIGAKLLPVFEKLADFLLGDGSGAFDKVGEVIEKVTPYIKDLAEKYLSAAKQAFEGLKDGMKDAQPLFDVLGTVITSVLFPALKKIYEIAGPAVGQAFRGIGKVFGAVGEIIRFTWNKVIGPVLRFLLGAIAEVADGFAAMLRGLSKVPGFGWAKGAADKLEGVADKLRDVKNGIEDIPPSKDVKINLRVQRFNAMASMSPAQLLDPYMPKDPPGNASGTARWRGGWTDVGERGRERVWLPAGSRVDNAAMSRDAAGGQVTERMMERAFTNALRAAKVRVVDAGQGAYLAGAGF